MKISVIIPVYNMRNYLCECVNSILKNNYDDYEVIMIDDGSDDGSGEICDDYSNRYNNIHVFHQKNMGLLCARREGLKKSSGEYIMFCDADDKISDKSLSLLSNEIDNSNADVILYNIMLLDGHKHPFYEHLFKNHQLIDKKVILNEIWTTLKYNSMCGKIFKRSIADINKDYSSMYKNNFGEDFLQSVYIFLNCDSIDYLDEYIYYYRVSSGMMRHYNKNYYTSYRDIANYVYNDLNYIVDDNDIKYSIYILNAACGQIMQFRFTEEFDIKEFDKIYDDYYFMKSYRIAYNSKLLKKYLPKKRRIIIKRISQRKVNHIKLIIKISKLKQNIKKYF